MTIKVYPIDSVSGSPSFTGRWLRNTLAPLMGPAPNGRPLGAVQGVRAGTPTNTVTATSSTWSVAAHCGVVDVEVSGVASAYCYAVTATETGSVNAASATHPRIDLISFTLADPAEDGSSNPPGGSFTYTAGTPAASPVAPSTPALSMDIAQINVPTSGGGSPTVTWIAPYFTTLGPDAISDWNTALAEGFYYAPGSASNSPVSGDAYVGITLGGGSSGILVQVVERYSSTAAVEQWQRNFDGSSWNPWTQTAGRPAYANLITFASGYRSTTGGGYAARACLYNGGVKMRGRIEKISGNFPSGVVLIGTVDSTLIPSEDVELTAACNSNSDYTAVRVEVSAGGNLSAVIPSTGDVLWISLDGTGYDLT